MKRILASLLVMALALSGCVPNMGPKETGGALLGAAGGAAIGSQIGHGTGRVVAVAIGTLAGALIGQGVGQSLDRADQLAMERNAQYALENTRTNATTTWRNPDSGNYGAITPVDTYQTASGQYCREYTQTVVVAGEKQQAYGTACRQPDGTWKVVK
ncbi:MAG: glycine zipper 2TM domain-containing protein [Desulfuromonas sp.]|nr:glycine zipper 2TM domain-containing protein [Desulfuromonas sp.]